MRTTGFLPRVHEHHRHLEQDLQLVGDDRRAGSRAASRRSRRPGGRSACRPAPRRLRLEALDLPRRDERRQLGELRDDARDRRRIVVSDLLRERFVLPRIDRPRHRSRQRSKGERVARPLELDYFARRSTADSVSQYTCDASTATAPGCASALRRLRDGDGLAAGDRRAHEAEPCGRRAARAAGLHGQRVRHRGREVEAVRVGGDRARRERAGRDGRRPRRRRARAGAPRPCRASRRCPSPRSRPRLVQKRRRPSRIIAHGSSPDDSTVTAPPSSGTRTMPAGVSSAAPVATYTAASSASRPRIAPVMVASGSDVPPVFATRASAPGVRCKVHVVTGGGEGDGGR